MSVNINNKDGTLTKVGSVGIGKLVPSVSHYQTGTVEVSELSPHTMSSMINVTFSKPMPDTDYVVVCDDFGASGSNTGSNRTQIHATVIQKTTTGFLLYFFNAGETTAFIVSATWQAFKLMTDESRALDEAAIEQNASDIDTLEDRVDTLEEKISYPKIYTVCGLILTSASAMRGYGSATVTLYANKTCRVDFSAKVTTAGTNSSQFTCGISATAIKALNSNIPTITPVKGGILQAFNAASGTYKNDDMGYAGVLESIAPYWTFARVYQTSGTTGAWSETNWNVGDILTGVARGTWA